MKKVLLGFAFLVFCSVVFLGGVVWWMVQPVRPDGSETTFVVKKGESFATVAARLEEAGIVRSGLVLRVLNRLDDSGSVIHPGTFTVSGAMSPFQLLGVFQQDTQDVWVTFPEGWRGEEIAEELTANLGETFSKEEFLALAAEKEGRLFPDTYLFSKTATAETIISVMENTFKKRYQSLLEDGLTPLYTQDKTLILASLVQREARTAEDMKIVAGILKNRLDQSMPLQVDATLQYVRGYDRINQTWWPEPRSQDKDLVSPYNTYAHPGLPPEPICNPGKDAIAAALSPTKTDYLFYISDRSGRMHYSKTFDEHKKLIQQYLR